MAKTLMYQCYPIPKSYPVWGEDDPLKPFYQWDVVNMSHLIPMWKELEVDVVWLSGIFKSPRYDHGYDIGDYYNPEPYVACETELINFVYDCHKAGIKVYVDLVLNHTSTRCKWFKKHPDWYWWSNEPKEGWHNLFNGGPAWEYHKDRKSYYLHMFHKEQADLKWFSDDGVINEELVEEFRRVVKHWMHWFNVDGFRLDVPQSINKDPATDELGFMDMVGNNDKAIEVINRVFDGIDCGLVMEMFDPTKDGIIMRDYLNKTKVNYIMNVLIKDKPAGELEEAIMSYSEYDNYMLDLESHDSMRFLSREGMNRDKEMNALFWYGAENICIYQGQELGLKNPELTDEQILALDAQTAMQHELGVPIDRLHTRANARVPYPEDELKRQQEDENSFLSRFEAEAHLWKRLP